jgi:hypothetical protein
MSIDAESDPHVEEREIGGHLPALELAIRQREKAVSQTHSPRPGTPVTLEHLVVEIFRFIGIESHDSAGNGCDQPLSNRRANVLVLEVPARLAILPHRPPLLNQQRIARGLLISACNSCGHTFQPHCHTPELLTRIDAFDTMCVMRNCFKSAVGACVAGLVLTIALVANAGEPSAEDIEFFEKNVRPVFAEMCQKCHGEGKQEGGLRLDSRVGMIQGGDSGAAVEPGKPDESLLIEAIGYAGDIRMPPKGKLADGQIAALTEWVRRGAPWPAGKFARERPADFNLAARKAKQWAFQPVSSPSPPLVRDGDRLQSPIDNFVQSKLEAAGLSPAGPADKRTLLRRVTFDLIGLPSTAAEIDDFLADQSPQAFERVVNRLLDSPRYGERWARHWLDLVRFAETHGHEFDFEMPLAYEYRDYVIRALNADVPYDQFVMEHVAGDLLAKPRRHPTEQFNESIIGTGFWFLGEATHSPVDIRADEAGRIDNQIDVFAKTFLAQTLACARCHDHKFDAISTKDYYALSGYLQSSRYDEVCVDPPDDRLAVVKELESLRVAEDRLLRSAAADLAEIAARKLSQCLLASLAVLNSDFDNALNKGDVSAAETSSVVFEDFEKATYAGWTATGNAFGDVPNRRPLPEYQRDVGALGQGFVNSHSALDKQGKRIATDELTGTLTSSPFKISQAYVHFLIGGGAHAGKTCLNLLVDGKAVRTATGRNNNRMDWSTFDVRDLAGKEGRFEIVDQERGGWGNIGVDQILFSKSPQPGPIAGRIAAAAKKYCISPEELSKWVMYLQGTALKLSADPFHLWALLASQPGELTGAAVAAFLSERIAVTEAGVRRSQDEARQFVVFEDFAKPDYAGWFVSGEAFGTCASAATPVAEMHVTGSLVSPGNGRVALSGALSRRVEGRLRSPTFTIEKNRILYHMGGTAAKVNLIIDGYQLIRYPIYGGLTIAIDAPERMRWYVQDVSKWVGHTAYMEFIDPGEGYLAVDRVLFSDAGAPEDEIDEAGRLVLEDHELDSPTKIATRYARLTGQALAAWSAANPKVATEPDRASNSLLNWLLAGDLEGALSHTLSASRPDLQQKLDEIARTKQRLEGRIHYRRKVMAMVDGTPEDDRVHLRGSPHKCGDVVPRRFLEAIGGHEQPAPENGSGRLDLARRVVDAANPLVARVLVNRVWKQHFGEGLVRTPDDFGNMGQAPTHPELLDYLTNEFVRRGWSIKHLHRLLVLSKTYQMASAPADPRAEEIDPQNRLWHRMNLRRLEGEAIRDSVLAISGRLNSSMFGPSVLPHLTPFMVGRGRPAGSGPLDGDGRRTIYLNVRRNFLNPMMLAFDFPIPFSTIGRRSVSNVPAQALALMNNPFVLEQAEVWARRVTAEQSNAESRIRAMYVSAFSRPPTVEEQEAATAFVAAQSGQYAAGEMLRPWADLAHVLFNVKEFIFID